MKPTRDRRLWFARGAFCLLGVLVLSLPVQALADGIVPGGVGDVVDDVTQTAGEVASDVVDGAGEAVEGTTDGAGDVVDEATETAGDVVEGTTDGAGDVVDEATGTAGDVVDEAAGTADEVVDEVDGVANDVTPAASDIAGTIGGVAEGVTGSAGSAGAGRRLRCGERSEQPRRRGHGAGSDHGWVGGIRHRIGVADRRGAVDAPRGRSAVLPMGLLGRCPRPVDPIRSDRRRWNGPERRGSLRRRPARVSRSPVRAR